MKPFALFILFTVATTSVPVAGGETIDVTFMLDELEYVIDDGADPVAWSAALAVGDSERQLWLVSEGGHDRGSLEEHEVHAYFAQALSKTTTLTLGWRGDLKPQPDRDWAMIGFENTLPLALRVP